MLKLQYTVRHRTSEVRLLKDDQCPLGISLSGNQRNRAIPTIASIKNGSAAQKSHCVAEGDAILTVNGVDTRGMSKKEVKRLLRSATSHVDLGVAYSTQEATFGYCRIYCSQRMFLTLRRDKGTFGFVLRKSAAGMEYPIISDITPGGPADKEGSMMAGDRLLEIDNQSLGFMSLSDAADILQSKMETNFLIEYNVGIIDLQKDRETHISIYCPDCELGMDVDGDERSGRMHISFIRQASLAQRCGAFHVGDEILSINDREARYLKTSKANDMLRLFWRGVGKIVYIHKGGKSKVESTSGSDITEVKSAQTMDVQSDSADSLYNEVPPNSFRSSYNNPLLLDTFFQSVDNYQSHNEYQLQVMSDIGSIYCNVDNLLRIITKRTYPTDESPHSEVFESTVSTPAETLGIKSQVHQINKRMRFLLMYVIKNGGHLSPDLSSNSQQQEEFVVNKTEVVDSLNVILNEKIAPKHLVSKLIETMDTFRGGCQFCLRDFYTVAFAVKKTVLLLALQIHPPRDQINIQQMLKRLNQLPIPCEDCKKPSVYQSSSETVRNASQEQIPSNKHKEQTCGKFANKPQISMKVNQLPIHCNDCLQLTREEFIGVSKTNKKFWIERPLPVEDLRKQSTTESTSEPGTLRQSLIHRNDIRNLSTINSTIGTNPKFSFLRQLSAPCGDSNKQYDTESTSQKSRYGRQFSVPFKDSKNPSSTESPSDSQHSLMLMSTSPLDVSPQRPSTESSGESQNSPIHRSVSQLNLPYDESWRRYGVESSSGLQSSLTRNNRTAHPLTTRTFGARASSSSGAPANTSQVSGSSKRSRNNIGLDLEQETVRYKLSKDRNSRTGETLNSRYRRSGTFSLSRETMVSQQSNDDENSSSPGYENGRTSSEVYHVHHNIHAIQEDSDSGTEYQREEPSSSYLQETQNSCQWKSNTDLHLDIEDVYEMDSFPSTSRYVQRSAFPKTDRKMIRKQLAAIRKSSLADRQTPDFGESNRKELCKSKSSQGFVVNQPEEQAIAGSSRECSSLENKFSTHPEVQEISLEAEGGDFGFIFGYTSLIADDETRKPIIVSIKPKSAAEINGLLMKGDRILAMNGFSTTGISLDELERLKRAAFSNTEVVLAVEFDVIDAELQWGTFDVELDASTKIGIVMDVPDNPTFVKSVVKGGAAHRSGLVHPGDQILSLINFYEDHFDLKTWSQSKKLHCRITLQRDKNPKPSKNEASLFDPVSFARSGNNFNIKRTSFRTVEVSSGEEKMILEQEFTLFRDPLTWDFGFMFGENPQNGNAYVMEIRPGGPADNSKIIKKYDRIIEVNGVIVDRKAENSIMALLMRTDDHVNLVTRRIISNR